MERVAFLIEATGARLSCLLNPESLVRRRVAGVRPRRAVSGQITGAGLGDDPLLYTGGGTTSLDLDLLFDVTLAGSSITTGDVRDLTGPLWNLAENTRQDGEYGQPPIVRFVWGKSWNIPGLVTAVAERLEYFTAEGVPQRSWLRLRLRRVDEPTVRRSELPSPAALAVSSLPLDQLAERLEVPPEEVRTHEMVGGAVDENAPAPGERLDAVAFRSYGDPALWRLLALFNGITDPLHIAAGFVLRIPLLSALRRSP